MDLLVWNKYESILLANEMTNRLEKAEKKENTTL